MMQMMQTGGKVRNLTEEELELMYRLKDGNYSEKEISDIVCLAFDRETLDRSTISRRMKKRDRQKRLRPILEIEKVAYSRCLAGDHSWIMDSQFAYHAYTPLPERSVRQDGAERTIQIVYGEKKCRFCRTIDGGKRQFFSDG